MDRNQRRPASRFAVAAAEAQHRQALAGYWPQISLRGAYELMDEPKNFVFPGQAFGIPSTTIPAANSSFTIPQGAFGGNSPAGDVTIPITSPAVTTPAMDYNLPDQDVKLQDEQSWYGSLEAKWLLWDGGMRKGLREQALAGVDIAHAELRRTNLEVIDSVTRMYYGAVAGKQLYQLGMDTLTRMEATLSLTKTLYEEGSGQVKKTDYLNNKMMVETLRAAVALLEKNEVMSQASLAYTMGLSWRDSVQPEADEIPFDPISVELEALVSDAYAFSPDWAQLEAGIRAAEGALGEARSGHYPTLAVTGDLHKWWNGYDSGYATDENTQGWTVGVGLELPLFQGFLTRHKVKAARARLGEIESRQILLREGIGLQVRDTVLGLGAAAKRYQATLDAMNSAIENRDLNTRAYQNDLVDTEDVIRAQLMEAFMSAQHYKIRYDYAELLSRLNLVVGTEVVRSLTGDRVR